MEPPTCTVLAIDVRATAAVATGPLPPGEVAVLSLPLADTAVTAPARAPAPAATATTRLAESSAIPARPEAGARPAAACRSRDISAARIDFREEAGRWCAAVGQSGRGDRDVPGRTRAVHPPGRQVQLLAAQLADVHDLRAVRVYAGALEVGLVPLGIGVAGDAVGAHALDELQVLGLVRCRGDRVGGLQFALGLGQVLAARTGEAADSRGRHDARLRDGDVDDSVGVDDRVCLGGIAVAALAGGPFVHQRGRVARPRGGRTRGAGTGRGVSGVTAGRSQVGDLRGARRATARGQREGGRRGEDREPFLVTFHEGQLYATGGHSPVTVVTCL